MKLASSRSATRPGRGAARLGLGRTGLRRVDWVRIHVEDGHLHAEAVGVGFRLPVTSPIPVSVAAELIAAGTPSVIITGDTVRSGSNRSVDASPSPTTGPA